MMRHFDRHRINSFSTVQLRFKLRFKVFIEVTVGDTPGFIEYGGFADQAEMIAAHAQVDAFMPAFQPFIIIAGLQWSLAGQMRSGNVVNAAPYNARFRNQHLGADLIRSFFMKCAESVEKKVNPAVLGDGNLEQPDRIVYSVASLEFLPLQMNCYLFYAK